MDEPPDIDWDERDRLRHQIYCFEQNEDESMAESWVRLKELLKNCYRHGLNRMDHVIMFYEGLNSDGKHYLDLAGEGDFYYMSPNEVFRIMEDLVKYEEYRLSPNFYESGLDAGQNEHEKSEKVVEFCLDNFDDVRHGPEAEIEVEESKGAEKIIEHPEIETYTIESENEDSEDEELFNQLFELIMENDTAEECVGDKEPEVLELETVSPIDETEKGLECLETVFPNEVINDVMVNPVEEMVEGHFDPFVEKTITTKEDLVGVASKVEDFNPIGERQVVEEEKLEKIDPESNDGLNGKNFNALNINSFVVCNFNLQDSDPVVEAYDLNAEFLEVIGNGDVGLMGVLDELDTGGVEHLYFDPFDEIRVTKEEEPTEIAFDPDPKDDERDIEAELRELIGSISGKEFRELKGIDIESITAENLDEFLCEINEPEPKEDTKGKTNSDFIDNCVSSILLIPRKKARRAYLMRKKSKVRCELGIFLMPMLILGCTRKWVDAIVKNFQKLFVTNEFCDLIAWFGVTNSYHSLK